jgi:hypothetical protein
MSSFSVQISANIQRIPSHCIPNEVLRRTRTANKFNECLAPYKLRTLAQGDIEVSLAIHLANPGLRFKQYMQVPRDRGFSVGQ